MWTSRILRLWLKIWEAFGKDPRALVRFSKLKRSSLIKFQVEFKQVIYPFVLISRCWNLFPRVFILNLNYILKHQVEEKVLSVHLYTHVWTSPYMTWTHISTEDLHADFFVYFKSFALVMWDMFSQYIKMSFLQSTNAYHIFTRGKWVYHAW